MKLSYGNKILLAILFVMMILSLTVREERSVKKQPTDLLDLIAMRGIPMCGSSSARYRLKDAEERIFRELSLEDREKIFRDGKVEDDAAVMSHGEPIAVVFIGRYEGKKIPEFVGLPMFLFFLRAGGEGICLQDAVVGKLPIHEEIARKYENR